MKNKFMNKQTLAALSVLLVLLVTVGGTLAYVFMNTDSVTNTFTPAQVSCAVVEVENGEETEHDNDKVSVSSKSNVQIKSTSNTNAYIRAKVVVAWKSAIVAWKSASGTVYAKSPVLGSDYSMSLASGTGWIEGADGYYYYTEAIAPGEKTGVLISAANQLKDGPKGADGTQYYLSIEIVASAIQSTPDSVVSTEWDNDKVNVTGYNGTLTVTAKQGG